MSAMELRLRFVNRYTVGAAGLILKNRITNTAANILGIAIKKTIMPSYVVGGLRDMVNRDKRFGGVAIGEMRRMQRINIDAYNLLSAGDVKEFNRRYGNPGEKRPIATKHNPLAHLSRDISIKLSDYSFQHCINLICADLSGRKLDGIRLVDIDLTGANLQGVSARKARLQQVLMENADLSGADFAHAGFFYPYLDHVNFQNANLFGASFNLPLSSAHPRVVLEGANLMGVEIGPEGADLYRLTA